MAKKKRKHNAKTNVTRSKFGKKKSNMTHEEWAKRFDIAYNKIKMYFSLKEIEEMIEARIGTGT